MARDRASRPGAKPQRLFVAVDVPDGVRSQLSDAIAPVRERVRGKWVPAENWHVTMKFLGSTWPRLLEWVQETCARVAGQHEPIETSLTGLGAFPTARRARVLWAGLDDPDSQLAGIATSLDESLASEFAPEKRGFTAHLTVARFDPPTVALGEDLKTIAVVTDPFAIDRLTLYRSHLRRPAPVYERVGDFPLGR